MRTTKIYLLIAIILLGVIFTGEAQETNAFHRDSTGKLFVRPHTPVYIYMSTKPDGSNAVRLTSLQPEGNPLKWDGHGLKQLTHINVYFGYKVRFDLYTDGKPPKTSTTFNPKLGFQKGESIFLSGMCVMELNSIDENSGTYGIFYSINQAPYLKYSTPLHFDSEGEYNLQFYSVDNVGNQEDSGERKVVIDITPPQTTLLVDGSKHNDVLSYRSKIALSATDAIGVKETFYRINQGPQVLYSKPIALSTLPEGEHSLTWYSSDLVGNIEPENTYNFFIDKTPPLVFEEIAGNTYMMASKEFSSGRSQLKIVAVDNKAGVKGIYYSINNSEFKLYEKPIYLSEITGAVTIRSYAIDNVGNKGTSDASGQQFAMPEVDIVGPSIVHSFVGSKISLRDTLWISPVTKIFISANDKGAGMNRIEYKLNTSPTQPYGEAFTVPQPGYHQINCTAYDNVENLNISSFGFGVDADAPEIHYHFSVNPFSFALENDNKIPVFSSDVKLFLGATDNFSGLQNIYYSINGLKERVYNEPLGNFRVGIINTIAVKAIDRLGNEAHWTYSFKVE